MKVESNTSPHHVLIVGGGFAGLFAAKFLGNAPLRVTLIDRRNFHLFQPLLYQIATGGLSPGDITSPLRAVLRRYKNVWVLQAEVLDFDPHRRKVILRDGELTYDTLIIATGVRHHYFGNDMWGKTAPGLKTIEDALDIRRRILLAFEAAERESDPAVRKEWLTFVLVGGGPTGVELAGALGELAHGTLRKDFRNFDPATVDIILLEGTGRVLPTYPPKLSACAEARLKKLGVTVRTRSLVTDIRGVKLKVRTGEVEWIIRSRTILWTAGVKASSLSLVIKKRCQAALDRLGRVNVEPDLTVPGYPEIFVIGDLAHCLQENGKPLPGVAPVAMQQGCYVAKLIRRRIQGKSMHPFRYWDKGNLAVIGRNVAVADIGPLHFNGFLAWLAWIFVHIAYLIGFDNKLLVLFQWAWNYFTRKRGARLITGADPFPLVKSKRSSRHKSYP